MLQVAMLFRSHKDLLEEFTYFLPDAQAPAQVRPSLQRRHHILHWSLRDGQELISHSTWGLREATVPEEHHAGVPEAFRASLLEGKLSIEHARVLVRAGERCLSRCRLQSAKHVPKQASAGGLPQTLVWCATCTSARQVAPGGVTTMVTN